MSLEETKRKALDLSRKLKDEEGVGAECRECGMRGEKAPQWVCEECNIVNWDGDVEGRVLVFDLDGVVHKYSKGWHDGTMYDPPMEGAIETLSKLKKKGWTLILFTARANLDEARAWLAGWWVTLSGEGRPPKITNYKPGAVAYVDDRGRRFNPDGGYGWDDVLREFGQ